MATHLGYWEYDAGKPLVCPDCGWRGIGKGQEEYFSALFDVRCPSCQSMLLNVPFPTDAETRAAAAAGNPAAVAELPRLDARSTRLTRAEQLQLERPNQLPDLPGAKVRVDWDFEESEGETWTILRHSGKEIWRELAFWEGYERFAAVFDILRERYGSGLMEVRPTPDSRLYLYGDRISASAIVARLNASLNKDEGEGSMALTPGQKAAQTRKRRAAGRKAAATKKRRAAGAKAAKTRKLRAAGRKAAVTRKRKAAARKAAATRALRKGAGKSE